MIARILVTGSRTWTDNTIIRDALTPFRTPGAVLVHGNARGADRIAAGIWRTWGLPTEAHTADWDTHGRAAGMHRNRHMVALGADMCLAFIRDHSPGATHCAAIARARRHPRPALPDGDTAVSTAPARPLQVVPDRPRTAWTADELMAMSFPEPTWAVPGIIAEGVNLLAGPPKVGKSWLSLGLGLCIAAGTPAFGTIPVESGPVLYLALEDTPRRLQNRMRKVLDGRRAPAVLTLDVHCPPLPNGGDFYIAEWLDANPGARLVVIDVFTKVRGKPPEGTGSAYEADYYAVGKAKALADTYGVAVVLVHHVRKAASEDFLQTVSGTNGLAGAADAVLVLERKRAQADGILHVTGRDVDETEYPLAFNKDAGAWTLLDGPAEDYLMQDTRALIARFVRDYPGQKPAHIAAALEINPATLRKTLTRMVDAGQLHVKSGGSYYPPTGGTSSGTPEVPHLPHLPLTPADQGGHL
jgi:hypothetical protein